MHEGNDKETFSLEASRNTVCLCYVIVADGGGLGEGRKEAAQLLDRKWVSNQKQSERQEIHPSGEKSEVVVTFKQYCGQPLNI